MTEHIKRIRASDHDSYGTFTIIAVLIPIVGLILGIVYLAKDNKIDKKLGEHLLAVSILFGLVYASLIGFLSFRNQSNYVAPTNAVVSSDPLTDINVAQSDPAWDANIAYEKIQTGLTKEQVETTIGKTGTSCTETQVMDQKAESCSYGDATNNAIIIVQYDNGVVSSKAKTNL